jgi:hypothetical protein
VENSGFVVLGVAASESPESPTNQEVLRLVYRMEGRVHRGNFKKDSVDLAFEKFSPKN